MSAKEEGTTSNKTANPIKAKRRRAGLRLSLRQWRRFFSVASALLVVMLILTTVLAWKHYKTYPGHVERDSVIIDGRGENYVSLSWDPPANADLYTVFVKEYDESFDDSNADIEPDDSWMLSESSIPALTIGGLREGTRYSFMIRAEKDGHSSRVTRPRSFTTKKTQDIELTGSKRIIYHLDADNCEIVKSVSGAWGSVSLRYGCSGTAAMSTPRIAAGMQGSSCDACPDRQSTVSIISTCTI